MRRRVVGVGCSVIAGIATIVAVVVAGGAGAASPSTRPAQGPLPWTNNDPAPTGQGRRPYPLGRQDAPQNPYLARNDGNNLHLNAYQTDATDDAGPLGRFPTVSSMLLGGESSTITQDSYGHLVTMVITPVQNILEVIDGKTMTVLSTYRFPVNLARLEPQPGGTVNVSGGGYFYLDNANRAVVSTLDGRIFAIVVHPDASTSVDTVVDVSRYLPAGDDIHSTLPDWSGRVWFTTSHGTVGVISGFHSPRPQVHTIALGEPIKKSFASDSDGSMSIVSDRALYRFVAGPDGLPRVDWRTVYPNTGRIEPGKLSAGAGSTPALMDDKWVATTDNADPTDLVVYRRGPASLEGGKQVCRVPVFAAGQSASFQAVTWADGQLLVENNYGYTGLLSTTGGKTTVAGLTAIAFDERTERCTVKWTNTELSSPSAIPTLSLDNGLVYTVTKPFSSSGADDWYLTALDWRTGKAVFSLRYGSGLLMNNDYTAVTLTPDGSAYIGVVGGLVRVADMPHHPTSPR